MTRLDNGDIALNQEDIAAVRDLIVAESRRVESIHATTLASINNFVPQWENLTGEAFGRGRGL